jgi:hypothetical protein
MGLPVSLILIAVGAILAFAVHQDPNPSVDIDVVGWVLLIVGLVGLLLSLLWWERWGPGYWGWHRDYAAAGPGNGRYPRRFRYGYGPGRGYGRSRTIVEEDEQAPPGPPPGAPPPP